MDIEDYEENMLIALLDMLICLSEENAIYNISYDVIDNICKMDYTYPEVYYKGKYYSGKTLEELLKRKVGDLDELQGIM